MYVVSGSRQRTIMLMEEDSRLGTSPNITHGDLAPDKMSSTKLKRVSVADTTTEVQADWELKENNVPNVRKKTRVNGSTSSCDKNNQNHDNAA